MLAGRSSKTRQSWIRKLIDLSRRNNLLYFRPLKRGTLDLTSAPSERLHDLLMGQSVAVAKLAPDLEDEALTRFNRPTQRLRLRPMRRAIHAVCWLSPPHMKRLAISPRRSALSARAQGDWDRVPTRSISYH